MRPCVSRTAVLMFGIRFGLLISLPWLPGTVMAGVPGNHLLPDMFPFVEEDAPANMRTLQAWEISGSRIIFNSMYANQGDGLFEIRRGPDVGNGRYEVLQRVYIDDDNPDTGNNYEDFSAGTAPIPGSPGNPNPNILPPYDTQSNLIWFEDFANFSLYEAPVVDGVLTVGDQVASNIKSSWRVSGNRGPLPGYSQNSPNYSSDDKSQQQRISVGYADLYSAGSSGQFIDIAGVAPGPSYWLRQTVDPNNRIRETDETNNSFEVLIDLNKPGEAFMIAGQFVQPGDPVPTVPGDLNADGQINLEDWLAFQTRADVDLTGLTPDEALLQGDLDLNGQHGLPDYVLFREIYDEAQGSGAFATLLTLVPEPSTLVFLTGMGISMALAGRHWRYPDRGNPG